MTDRDDTDQFDRDDDLRALLRVGDPAPSLRPADQAALGLFLAEITRAPADAARGRTYRPLTWLVGAAAAAVVLTAGVGAVHRATTDDANGTAGRHATPAPPGSQATQSTDPTAPDAAPVSSLRVSSSAFDARCAVPNAAMLASTDTAFSGTVTAIDGNRVTIARSATYHGSVADTVTVRAPSGDFDRLIQTVHFRVGQSYLVSASDGQLALCGFSGPAKRDLQSIYTEAFPR